MRLETDMMAGTINPFRKYAPRNSHVDVLASTKRELLISGPAGTGKSRACLEKLNYCALTYPGSRHLILRQARSSLSDTGLVTFERDVLGYDNPLVTNGPKRPWRRTYDYDNESQIVTGGLDKPDKILSGEYDTVFIQQAEETALQAWEILTTRLRNNKLPFQQILADCNPQHPSHWLRQRSKSNKTEYIESHHKDNPLLWDGQDWTEAGKQYLETLNRLTGTTKLRLRYGQWVSPPGQIYDIFSEGLSGYDEIQTHRVASFPIPAHWPRAVGIDPAGQMRAAVWLAFHPERGILNLYRELLEPFGSTVKRFVGKIKEASAGEPVFAWVCGAKSERDWRTEFEAEGLPVIAPPISDVWIGIDKVYDLLKEFKLVIHDNCVATLSEMGDYRRKIGRDGIVTDTIVNKGTYHLLDSIRVLVAHLATPTERTIQTVNYSPMRIGGR